MRRSLLGMFLLASTLTVQAGNPTVGVLVMTTDSNNTIRYELKFNSQEQCQKYLDTTVEKTKAVFGTVQVHKMECSNPA